MNKFLSILGLCRRAGKLVMGYDASVLSVKNKKAHLIIIAQDVSAKTEKNAVFEANRENIDVLKCIYPIDEIGLAIGKKAGILAVLDENFAKGLRDEMQNQTEKG